MVMSISLVGVILEARLWNAELEWNLFSISLIGTTIQDGGWRERRDVTSYPFFCLSSK